MGQNDLLMNKLVKEEGRLYQSWEIHYIFGGHTYLMKDREIGDPLLVH